MRYLVEHETRLAFAEPVVEHHCEIRLVPHDDAFQRVHALTLEVDPPARLFTYIDGFGNRVHHFGVLEPHLSLVTRARAEVETLLQNPFDYAPIAPERERAWIADALQAQPRLWDFVLHCSTATPAALSLATTGLVLPEYDPRRPVLESVLAASQWVTATFAYRSGVTEVHAQLCDMIAARAGVCQDFAHLLIAIARSWGFPARYVMGYHELDAPEEPGSPGVHWPHAWAQVLIPGAGWRGFDPTTGLVANDTYVSVAVGRDSLDAAPQRGSFKGQAEDQPPEVALRLIRQQ